MAIETNRAKIVRRLESEGWIGRAGGSHDVFKHIERAGRIVVPCHRELSPGVACGIARDAGWM